MASTALKGTVFAFWLFFQCIFINYCNYRVNHREFLWLIVASRYQMSSDINILYHSYQQLVHITRNGLNTKHSLHFSAYFTFLSILVNFPLTGNDICHSQPKPWYFIISNASHSIYLFLAQWRHISSESAVALLFSFPSNCVNIWQQNVLAVLIAKCDAQLKAWDILLVLTSVAGNLCNKCLSGYSNKTAIKVILSMRSLVSIEQQSPRRPCDIFSMEFFLSCLFIKLARSGDFEKGSSCFMIISWWSISWFVYQWHNFTVVSLQCHKTVNMWCCCFCFCFFFISRQND